MEVSLFLNVCGYYLSIHIHRTPIKGFSKLPQNFKLILGVSLIKFPFYT